MTKKHDKISMIIKPQDYDNLRQAGRINARVLATLRDVIEPGMRTRDLDAIAREIITQEGAEAPFLGYPPGGRFPYPAAINVSINEQLVHGIPGRQKVRAGDLVTLDCGTRYNGLIADSAITVVVGDKTTPELERLICATEEALHVGIQIAKPGRRIGDIAFAIQAVLQKYKVNIPPQFGGHGVGYELHAPPHVPNWGLPNRGDVLRVGMALAIEPMGMYGKPDTKLLDDHWTVVTLDHSICAHTEHTVLITENGAEIMTELPY